MGSIFDNVRVGSPEPTSALPAVIEDVYATMERRILLAVEARLSSIEHPTITVQPAAVQVEAPVTVQASEVLPPDVVIDLGDLAAAQRETNTLLVSIAALLERPVVRTVTRDAEGRILSVTERR